MKLLIKLYSNTFCHIIKAEEIEIKSKKITVKQLKNKISSKFHIPSSEQILTIFYENKNFSKLLTLSDEFPLYYFFIRNNSEIYLEHHKKIDKTQEICDRLKNTKNKKIKKLNLFSDNIISSKRKLEIIKESENEYADTFNISEDVESKNEIIRQAIKYIIENKIAFFKEYIYINDFIQEDMSILTNKENGWNALHYSCFYGNEEMTETLIKLFNPTAELINGLTNDGYTPLHLACIKGHINIIRTLLYLKEIDVNIINKKDGTPLHIACRKNNMQIVSILISYKANLYLKDYNDKYPYELTSDINIQKLLKKSMMHSFDNDTIDLVTSDTELSLYVDNFFTPPRPPIIIGFVEKRGNFLPIYDTIFIEVNPIYGNIKKYKNSHDYPDTSYQLIDLKSITVCKREFITATDAFYFSINYSTKEIYRVQNEQSMKKWLKSINESIIYCKFWEKIGKINKKASDFLSKQNNYIEIVERDGTVKNYEEEQKKKKTKSKVRKEKSH